MTGWIKEKYFIEIRIFNVFHHLETTSAVELFTFFFSFLLNWQGIMREEEDEKKLSSIKYAHSVHYNAYLAVNVRIVSFN